MFEALRLLFGPNRYEARPLARELLPAAITFAIAGVAAWLIVDAVEGRSYPFSQGRLFFGATLAWLAVMRGRAILARVFGANPVGGPLARASATLLSRTTILVLTWYPGLAVGWYSVEAANRPSTNSQGVDVCAVSTAQYCVSGPRALIPWAIVLLVASAFATWFFVRSWTVARRRDPEPAMTPGEAMVANILALFPDAQVVEPTPEPTRDVVDDLARLAEMKEQGHLTEAEFEAAKRRILGATE